jgi:hypothetical protein
MIKRGDPGVILGIASVDGQRASPMRRTRNMVPAYASMLGFAVRDMGRVRERAAEYQGKGYRAQK